jgi:hypothetical protein
MTKRANEFSRACDDKPFAKPISITTRPGGLHAFTAAHRFRSPRFAATMTFEASDANAVVCARGVYRAGCAGPNAAVVVRKPVPVVRCTRVLVNGVYVKRCV